MQTSGDRATRKRLLCCTEKYLLLHPETTLSVLLDRDVWTGDDCLDDTLAVLALARARGLEGLDGVLKLEARSKV
jgi:hypothetical protein